LRLPQARPAYSQIDDQTARSLIERADAENHKRNRDVEVSPGRLILQSPNGTRWSIEVSNSGVISASSL
jgi:hypothetical protein